MVSRTEKPKADLFRQPWMHRAGPIPVTWFGNELGCTPESKLQRKSTDLKKTLNQIAAYNRISSDPKNLVRFGMDRDHSVGSNFGFRGFPPFSRGFPPFSRGFPPQFGFRFFNVFPFFFVFFKFVDCFLQFLQRSDAECHIDKKIRRTNQF